MGAGWRSEWRSESSFGASGRYTEHPSKGVAMALKLLSAMLRSARWAAWSAAFVLPWGSTWAQSTYTVSVVPQFQAVEINRVWAPILERLGRETGDTYVLKVAKDIPTFEADFAAGRPDFVYLNPYHQVLANKSQGYVPLVRDSKLLTGILVVRSDDPIKSTKELQGKEVAFPAPNAFGSTLLIRAHLAEVDKIDIKPRFANTHANAYRLTLTGKTAASGGLRATLNREPDEVRAATRVLYETPGFAPHPLSAHPRVPTKAQQALASAWLKLGTDPALQANFQDIPMANPVRADYAKDYLPLEKLRLDKLAE
jgi:phosphonate transport system substrate-binding protein